MQIMHKRSMNVIFYNKIFEFLIGKKKRFEEQQSKLYENNSIKQLCRVTKICKYQSILVHLNQ